ncbi:MAG: DUF1993 domain-containing protein [Alphaproteobacteria bacterium]|nr:DUF1993 domain-containing protein [Alphaproteobacteria bacterium]MBV8407887.1 DUF1993 domain-containing protein [Alphaproteobacteria bacterium]
MALSLYDLCVPTYLQILGGAEGFLAKAKQHFADNKQDPDEVVEAKLAPDMLPFRFQIVAAAHHSLGALKAVQAGQFAPPAPSTADYAGLQKLVSDAKEAVQKMTPAEVNACSGKDVTFQVRDTKIPFIAEGFIQSFSLPNFYFHATTAYDILRSKGVPVGKRDFLGKLQIKS